MKQLTGVQRYIFTHRIPYGLQDLTRTLLQVEKGHCQLGTSPRPHKWGGSKFRCSHCSRGPRSVGGGSSYTLPNPKKTNNHSSHLLFC